MLGKKVAPRHGPKSKSLHCQDGHIFDAGTVRNSVVLVVVCEASAAVFVVVFVVGGGHVSQSTGHLSVNAARTISDGVVHVAIPVSAHKAASGTPLQSAVEVVVVVSAVVVGVVKLVRGVPAVLVAVVV